MTLDLLAPESTGTFNTIVARKLGLKTAVYLNLLIDINRKAYRHKKVDDNGFFTIDREYVKFRTSLSSLEQREADKVLSQAGVLKISSFSNDSLHIEVDNVTGLILDSNEKVNKELKEITKSKREVENDKVKMNLRGNVKTQNIDLKQAYYDWIDSVLAKRGWMTSAQVNEGQKVVDNYSKGNLDVALGLIRTAIMFGYVDIIWAISCYEKDRKSISTKPYTPPNPTNSTPFSETTY